MSSEKSEIERSLQTILRDEPIPLNATLIEILPEANFAARSEEIKRNMSDFIQSCLENKKLVTEIIERGIKNDKFNSAHQKNLALFSVEVLGGDYGDAYKLFIEGEEERKSIRKSRSMRNEPQIEQQIEGETESAEEKFIQKYSNFECLLEYMRRSGGQLSEVCVNYFNKIMGNIISNRAEDIYAFFDHKQNWAISKPKEQNNNKTVLEDLIGHSYRFGGIAEMLGKLVSEEGPVNKYVHIKKYIIEQIIQLLKSDELLRDSPSYYQNLLEFVSYVLSRTKYRSDENTDQITVICQRFTDEDIIWYFKEKVVRAVVDSNSLLSANFMNSSGTLNRSESCKSARKESELKPQNEQEFGKLQLVFENAIKYLKIIMERINYEQEAQKYHGQSESMPQPTMSFQVDEAIFGQNSLYELLTLSLPFRYKNICKMWFYELLLMITRNSRYKKVDPVKQIGLLPSSAVPILIHLLKVFRKEYKHNGLVNFYVGEILCEAILPKIDKLESKEAMMVLSALNPSEQVLTEFHDTRVFFIKILLVLEKKCEWFAQHFVKSGINVNEIKERFRTKLGGAISNRKNTVKQFEFLFDNEILKDNKNNLNKRQKSDRIEDDSSSDDEKQFKEFNPRTQFNYPKSEHESQLKQAQSEPSETIDIEQNLFKAESSEIVQEIKVEGIDEAGKQDSHRKQSEIELYVDSAGSDEQQNEVSTDKMKDENTYA